MEEELLMPDPGPPRECYPPKWPPELQGRGLNSHLSLQPPSEKSWPLTGMKQSPQLPEICVNLGVPPTHAWHPTHSGWATTPASPSAPCCCSVQGSLEGKGEEDRRHSDQPGDTGLDPWPEGGL